MSLEPIPPIFTVGRLPGDSLRQRFRWKDPRGFEYQFTVVIARNDSIPSCEENRILDMVGKKTLALRRTRRLFDRAMRKWGHDLLNFPNWSKSSITRFTIRTDSDDGEPSLIVDSDPSTIHLPLVSTIILCHSSIDVVDGSDLKHLQWLGNFRYVSLVDSKSGRFVRKGVDRDHPEAIKSWTTELVNLRRLQASPFIVRLVAVVKIRNPFDPEGEDVIDSFLLEYGSCGSLNDYIGNCPNSDWTKWMLQVAKGLQYMHSLQIVHGDLKPENIIITESRDARIIDLAQSGYTERYRAPEFADLVEHGKPWHPGLDVYAFGAVYWHLFNGNIDFLPEPGTNFSSPVLNTLSACLAPDVQSRPSIQKIIESLESMIEGIFFTFGQLMSIRPGHHLWWKSSSVIYVNLACLWLSRSRQLCGTYWKKRSINQFSAD